MVSRSISDTGPIIHLTEIDSLVVLDIFSEILIPEEVSNELRLSKTLIPKKIKIFGIRPEFKNNVKVLTNQENLDLGEASAIILSIQEKADCFLTDDLDARNVALKYNLEVHGTVGVILRAFREKIINKKVAIEKIKELHTNSSLFITEDLINEVIGAVEEFEENKR
jgi:predicted nucleic acid-binding protein